MSSTYLSTSASSISEATRTGTSLPSTTLRFSLTTSSLLHSVQRRRSLPWQTQPRLAHSISLARSGLGVQSVISWNVASRRISWSRSPGQYRGAEGPLALPCPADKEPSVRRSVTPAPPPTTEMEGLATPSAAGVELGAPTRRRLRKSALAEEEEDGEFASKRIMEGSVVSSSAAAAGVLEIRGELLEARGEMAG